jgi:heterotetrameric sarcosine oxidase gamma subunit
MREPHVLLEPVRWSALLRLRVSMASAENVTRRLSLPPALQSATTDGRLTLWIAPDQWLLASERESARALIERHASALRDVLHLLVDVSAALHCVRLSGTQGRALLAMGSGVDWSLASTPPGYSTRTRLAQIPAIAHVTTSGSIDVFVDRSHRDYLERWCERSASDPLLRERPCPNTY